MPDHFEELFADLRVATLPRVLPPGADAARRTAHRRRTTRTTTVAAVVVAVAAATQLATPVPESTRNAARAVEVLMASGRAGAARGTSGRELKATPPPGDYELALVCAGPGTLALTVQAVTETGGRPLTLLEKRVQCRDLDPRVGGTDLITLPEHAGFRLSAVPDGPARNRAGWAYHLRPQ